MSGYAPARRPLAFGAAAGDFYSLPALAAAGFSAVARLPVSLRIVLESAAAQLRRHAVSEAAHSRSSPAGSQTRRAARKSPSSSPASCCRTSPACRCSPTSPPCATSRWRKAWPATTCRAAGAGRSGGRPLGAGRSLRHAAGARSQHGAGIPAQPRALPVPEMGHAGLRDLQGRAAGHRHRASGQSRIPRPTACSRAGRPLSIPTRWSAPTRTRR